MQKHEPKNNLAPQIQCCIPTLSIKKNTLTPNNAGNCENRIPSYQQQICDSSSHWPRQAFSSSKRHEEQTNMFRLNLVSTTAPCPTAHSPPSTAITSTPYSSASFVSSSCRKKIIAWNALFPWAFRKHYKIRSIKSYIHFHYWLWFWRKLNKSPHCNNFQNIPTDNSRTDLACIFAMCGEIRERNLPR